MPIEGKIYSINESNKYKWTDIKWSKYINLLINNKYTTRWVGSMVADVHRTLIKGGIFTYPENKSNVNGRLRLLYEVLPMSYIFIKCGGVAFNKDNKNLLNTTFNYNKNEIHQKAPIILCGIKEYNLYKKC